MPVRIGPRSKRLLPPLRRLHVRQLESLGSLKVRVLLRHKINEVDDYHVDLAVDHLDVMPHLAECYYDEPV